MSSSALNYAENGTKPAVSSRSKNQKGLGSKSHHWTCRFPPNRKPRFSIVVTRAQTQWTGWIEQVCSSKVGFLGSLQPPVLLSFMFKASNFLPPIEVFEMFYTEMGGGNAALTCLGKKTDFTPSKSNLHKLICRKNQAHNYFCSASTTN